MLNHMLIKLLILSIGCSGSMLWAERNASSSPTTTSTARTNPSQTPPPPAPGNFGTLQITGSEKIGGNLTVVEDVLVKNNVSVTKLALQNNLTVGDALNVNGCLNINDNLKITNYLNADDVNADTSTICRENCNSLEVCANNTNNLTVVNNARVGGIAAVDTIAPFNNITTCLGGNVAVSDKKIVFTNQINPVRCICCPCNDQSPRGCSTACTERCIENDCGTTCFSGDVGIMPQAPTKAPNKLLVNNINPVQLDACGNCVPNEDGTTKMSGNVVLVNIPALECQFSHGTAEEYDYCPANPFPTLFVNEISPVTQDEYGNWIEDDYGVTCFSGIQGNSGHINGIAISPTHTLYVNEINPVRFCVEEYEYEHTDYPLDSETTFCPKPACCLEDLSPCAFTQINSNIRISNPRLLNNNSRIIGQLNCSEAIANESFDYCHQFPEYVEPITLHPTLGNCLPMTTCEPVLRLTFAQTDTTQTPFPQGAWVKLNVFGTGIINGVFSEPFDLFTQLYFYVGAGHPAKCSSFVGTLNGLLFGNTLSSQLCVGMTNHPFLSPGLPPHFPLTGQISEQSLFGLVPTAQNVLTVPAIIGTTVTSPDFPNATDIMLKGIIPDLTFGADSFGIYNIDIYYEIISSNLDPNTPPCIPQPHFNQTLYNNACTQLLDIFVEDYSLPCLTCCG